MLLGKQNRLAGVQAFDEHLFFPQQLSGVWQIAVHNFESKCADHSLTPPVSSKRRRACVTELTSHFGNSTDCVLGRG